MKRITLVLGLVALMAAMMAALAAPAMAKDNDGHKGGGNNRLDNQLGRLDNRLDRLDNRFDLDDGVLVGDVGLSPVFVTDEGLADELCSPLSSDAINNAIPGCIFGDGNDDLNFVSGVDFDTVGVRNDVFDNDFDAVGFVSDIDDGHFVDVDFDRGTHFTNGNNHNGNAKGNNHNGEGGKKGNGK